MQRLKIYQSLWAMQLRRPGVEERTNEENFRMISEAGYDGVCLDPDASEIDENLTLKPFFEKYDLGCMINAFPKNTEDLRRLLDFAKEMKARQFNIIGMVYPMTVTGAVPIIRRWIEVSEAAGVPVLFETHRDCITNDMFFTLQLLDAIPEMRLCADLSHYVVNRELQLPLTPHWQILFDRLLHRSDSFQGRVASREQIQVALAFPQHQAWVELFKSWWVRGISDWRDRSDKNAELIFLCELGPPPYAITNADGQELSDRWEEAKVIREWIREIWSAYP